MTDPDAAPHGGESLRAFAARVRGWLDEQATLDGTAVAITHGGVVKAAVVHALGAPIEAFWRVDCRAAGRHRAARPRRPLDGDARQLPAAASRGDTRSRRAGATARAGDERRGPRRRLRRGRRLRRPARAGTRSRASARALARRGVGLRPEPRARRAYASALVASAALPPS